MTEQEIVKEWKQNDRYWASPNITDEMREWAMKNRKDMQRFDDGRVWCGNNTHFYNFYTYRLRPDFELPKEPEFEYLEIKTDRNMAGYKYAAMYRDSLYIGDVAFAPSIVGFVGYCVAKDDTIPFDDTFKPFHKFVKIKKD